MADGSEAVLAWSDLLDFFVAGASVVLDAERLRVVAVVVGC